MITAKDLYLTYDSNKYIIKRGNFSIKEKEFVFIGGNSGSGKSTLLKSFYGDIPIKHGSLQISNQEVFKITECEWKTKTPFASIRRIVQLNKNILHLSTYRRIIEFYFWIMKH